MSVHSVKVDESSRKSFFQTGILLTQTYGVTLLGLIIGIFSARSLSVTDRGTLALLLLVTQLCSRLGSIGFEQLLQRNGAEGKLHIFYIAACIGTFLTVPVMYLGILPASNYLWTIPFLLLVSAFISILRINIALLIFSEDLGKLSLLNVGQSISQVLMYGLAFNSHSVRIFLLFWVTNVVVFSIISVVISRDRLRYKEMKNNLLSDAITVWKSGLQYSGIALPEMALSFCLELPIVRTVLGGTQAGLYSISNTLTSIYFQIFVSISAIAAKRQNFFSRPIIYTGLAIISFLGVILTRPVVNFMFGASYVGAAHFSAVMLPVTWLLGVVRVEQMIARRPVATRIQILLFIALILMIVCGLMFSQKYLLYIIGTSYAVFATVLLIIINKNSRVEDR